MAAWPAAALLGAVAALVAAPLLLARARARGIEGRSARWCGWLALPVAAALLAPVTGSEIAVAWVLAALPLPAWAWIAWHRERRPAGRERTPPTPATDASPGRRHPGRIGRAALRLVTALPLAGSAALLAAIGLARPVDSISGAAVTALGLLVALWALAAVWAFSDPRPGRPGLALLLATVMGAVSLWLA